MKIVIIDYGLGNILSLESALLRINIQPIITNQIEIIKEADKIIFPGVGEVNTAMQNINKLNLAKIIPLLHQPVLGICLGMQLMCNHSEENNTDCLKIFDTDVREFNPIQSTDKVPQIGWNNLHNLNTPLFKNIPENSFFYFVHSYFVPCNNYTIATANYVQPFSAAIQHKNFFGCQFHPEKSGLVGQQLLYNFIYNL